MRKNEQLYEQKKELFLEAFKLLNFKEKYIFLGEIICAFQYMYEIKESYGIDKAREKINDYPLCDEVKKLIITYC